MGLALHQERVAQKPRAEDLRHPLPQVGATGGVAQHRLVVVGQGEAGAKVTAGRALDHIEDARELRPPAAQKLAPRRDGLENVDGLHGGARGAGGRFQRRVAADRVEGQAPRRRRLRRSRSEGKPGHRRDAGQGLAAKPQAGDAVQIGLPVELAGAVATQGQLHVVGVDAMAVVADRDALAAPLRHGDVDLTRPRVQAVLHQLLDDRGGPLDHLPRRDLAR